MSGGALIALSDLALLGVHCGSTFRHWIAAAFDQSMYSDLVDTESSEQRAADTRLGSADSVVTQLKKRGYHKVLIGALGNLVPLYDASNSHVGCAVLDDLKLITTCPPGEYFVTDGTTKVSSSFTSGPGFFSECDFSPAISDRALPVVREPENYERVVIIGADDNGSYFSHETVVKQLGAGKRTFMLAATEGNVFPLVGGIVVSVQDGAVLGEYVRDSTSSVLGRLSLCVTMRPAPPREVVVTAEMQRVFPLLHFDSWDEELLSEVLRHPSAVGTRSVPSNSELASIGDAVMRLSIRLVLRQAKVPSSEWEGIFQQYQRNDVLSAIAWECGVARLLQVQPGLRMSASSKSYASLLEAIVGAAYLTEEHEVVQDFMRALGLVPSVQDLAPNIRTVGSLVRRVSENVVSAFERVGDVGFPPSPID